MSEFGGALDLSGADTSGFAPLDPGVYPAVVHEAEMTETKGGPQAKMPEGTPMLKVQFRITDPDDNHRAFGNYPIPGPDYDKDKAAKLKGNLVNMLVALGYDEKKITSGKFDLDVDDLVGRECDVVLNVKPDHNDPTEKVQNLRGVKPLGTASGGQGSGDDGLL